MKIIKKASAMLVAMCLVFGMFVATASAQDVIKINFQPESSEVPEGYLPDYGLVYGDRGNGYEYGWVEWDHTQLARAYPQAEKDPVLATLNQMGENTSWEIALPNGTYELTVCLYDPGYPTQNKGKLLLTAEDVVVIQNEEKSSPVGTVWTNPYENPPVYKTVTVQVKDGKLTLKSNDSAHKNIKLNNIEIKTISVDQASPAPSANTGSNTDSNSSSNTGTNTGSTSGSTSSSGSSSNSGGSATTGVVPSMPKTGMGGTSASNNTAVYAVLALAAVAVGAGIVLRKRVSE